MKIVFMGTPEFAAVSLKELADRGFEVCAVITQPDKVNARGNRVIPCAVKCCAESLGIPVFQPVTLKNGEGAEIFTRYSPDIAVVAAYGKLLPEALLRIPRFGCVNVHASLLPAYRGASPIQTAVMNGETVTGVTIMQLDVGMDTGDILSSEAVEIGADETAGELSARLAKTGASLLADTLLKLETGGITPVKQDESLATCAPLISKDEAVIDYHRPVRELVNLIRGLNPNPVARTLLNGQRLKVYAAAAGEAAEGSIGDARESGGRIAVVCGDGRELLLTEVQGEGSRRMDCESYLHGHPLLKKECE